jgi:hypothetical protein
MSSKIYGKAHRDKRLRDSGLFTIYPFLNNATILAVYMGYYVLVEDNYKYLVFEVEDNNSFALRSSICYGHKVEVIDLLADFIEYSYN